tara:strand:- start:557 stop:736 length:180 start_codon:yes stop_codon:yes gene_type:complete
MFLSLHHSFDSINPQGSPQYSTAALDNATCDDAACLIRPLSRAAENKKSRAPDNRGAAF